MESTHRCVPPFPSTAWEQWNDLKHNTSLSTGCQGLDKLLGGGINLGITEICGEASVGKTQLVLQLLLQVVAKIPSNQKMVTEPEFVFAWKSGHSTHKIRLKEMADALAEENPHLKDSIANCMDRIYLRFISLDMKYTEADFNWVLSKEIPVLLESHNVRLVVIDSIAAVYRQTFAFDKLGDRSLALFQIASYLKRISDENGCPVAAQSCQRWVLAGVLV
eukprot:jgi/Bigna1/142731/aug1.72_g17439